MTNTDQTRTKNSVRVVGEVAPGFDEILTPDALAFVAKLHRTFNGRRLDCLQRRAERQTMLDGGGT
ncbi:MAG: malate synthase A, partial [Chthoniobacterales bacterium]